VTSPEHERQSPAELADALARVLDPWTTLTA
jgi:hypothetical protein